MKKIAVILVLILLFPSVSACKKERAELPLYDIRLTLFSDMTASGTMLYTFTNHQEKSLSSAYFSVFPNAYSQTAKFLPVPSDRVLHAYPNGIDYGEIVVSQAKVNGENADFLVDGQTLKVGFNKPLEKQKTAEIYLEFSLKIPRVNHRFGYGDNTVNLTGFYPILCVYENGGYYESEYQTVGDPFYSNVSNYKVELTVPPEYTVASSMSVTQTEWSETETTYYYERNCVRDIAFVLSKNFSVAKRTSNGVEISYYYFNDADFENSLSVIENSLKYYSNAFMPYPYGEYAVCQADFLWGGMEYPALALISGTSGEQNSLVIAHETAHQWWYGIVGVNQNEYAFLDEGLTEISTALCLDALGITPYNTSLTQAVNGYKAIRESLVYNGVKTPPILERHLKDFSCELEYSIMAYNRSFIALNEVKNHLGDRRFFRLLKNFCRDYAFENATPKDFMCLANKQRKGALEILESYINGVAVVK